MLIAVVTAHLHLQLEASQGLKTNGKQVDGSNW